MCKCEAISLEEITCLKQRRRLTLLIDGWEDLLKRSLYSILAAEVSQYPIQALEAMEVAEAKNFIAVTTDNPTVMQAFRRKFQAKFYWVLTFPCFLHGLNTIIGEISTRQKVTWTLKQNCESRWYALILQILSILDHSPSQLPLIKTCKPLVNTIGDSETRDASLASCMLELIRAARKMSQIALDDGDHAGFWMHAKQVFNRRFHVMNTDYHSLALYLHPMCCKLATSQVANGRNFEFMLTTALTITQQWWWSESEAKSLVYDLKEYQKCTGAFAGAQADALGWWEQHPVTAKQCPLKAMAIILHLVAPHAANVKWYFSGLGGTQSVKRCNLTVDTFEALSKLHSSYVHHLHTHMHTQPQLGINPEVAADLTKNFTGVPPLAAQSESDSDDCLAGPEAVTDEELSSAFDALKRKKRDLETALPVSSSGILVDPELELDGNEVLEGQVYSWDELDTINNGTQPTGFVEDICVLDKSGNGRWDIQALLLSEGVVLAQ
ncbi:hypothetical protein V8E55_009849 [Tylopilus felleus]